MATDVYPASLKFIMSADPPEESGDFSRDASSYFRNYRNNVLSKFSMPVHEGDTPYTPQLKYGIKNKNEFSIAAPVKITSIDSTRMKEVDDFFRLAQMQRDQYKDTTGTRHPLLFFKSSDYEYQCAPGLTSSYFSKYPQRFVTHKVPLVLPLTYSRKIQRPYIPDFSLAGIYSRSGCIAYKH